MNNLTPEQEQKSREEFEVEYRKFSPCSNLKRGGFTGQIYADYLTQVAYEFWMLRHKTICVELPDQIIIDCKHNVVRLDEVIATLQAAGIGVKS